MLALINAIKRCTIAKPHDLFILRGLLSLALVTSTMAWSDSTFRDPLDLPAIAVQKPGSQPLLSVTAAGSRLVAVGLRGVIVLSDDFGATWRQAQSPVSSDLTSVHFPTPLQGWAVGHDSTILHTDDGGEHWLVQLDGRKAELQFVEHYQRLVDSGAQHYVKFVDEISMNFRKGPSLPYLGIWFENEKIGYAVGSFGMLVVTQDGGKTWNPWLDRIDNDQALNLNAVREIGSDIYVVGEQGAVFRLDREHSRFMRLATDYQGSFFGIAGNSEVLVAFGVRGAAWRSLDRGATWGSINTGIATAISDAVVDDRRMLLVSAAGVVLESNDSGTSFHPLKTPAMAFTGAHLISNTVVLSGLQGITTLAMP